MIPKFLLSASVAGLFCVSSAFAAPVPVSQQPDNPPQQSQPNGQNDQQNQQSKSVNGKVTNIAKDKRSFSVQPQNDQNKENKNESGSQNSNGAIVFLINGNTQIKGTVTVGSDVDVEYRPTPDGNIALIITPRNSGGGGSR